MRTSKAKYNKRNKNQLGVGCILLVKPRGPGPGGGGVISGGGPEKANQIRIHTNRYIDTKG